jgi:hypothetical protein
VVVGLSCGKCPLPAPPWVRRQLGRAREEGGGCGQSAACLRPVSGVLQLGGDVLVRPGRRLGVMPSPPVRIGLRVGGLRQRPVRTAPLLGRGGAVDRRAHQRMMEPHPRPELDQVRRLRRRCGGFDADPK